MQYEVGQIVYHKYRGKCVVVSDKPDCAGDPLVCELGDGDSPYRKRTPEERVFHAFSSLLSTKPPKSESTKYQPLLIKGQGSYTITIEEGDV